MKNPNDDVKLNDTETLTALNAEVDAAIARRSAWLDSRMADYADVPIGEDIYDVQTGQRLGVVTKHDRYWKDRDPRYDIDPVPYCEYETMPGCFDNTKRQMGRWFGTRADAAAMAERRAKQFQSTTSE